MVEARDNSMLIKAFSNKEKVFTKTKEFDRIS